MPVLTETRPETRPKTQKTKETKEAPPSPRKFSPAKVWLFALALPLTLLFLEWTAHFILFGAQFGVSLLLITLVSLLVGGVLALIVSLFKHSRTRRIWTLVLQAVFAVFFCIYEIYFAFFHTFFSWHTIGLAGDVTQFWRETLYCIGKNFYVIVIAFLPLFCTWFFTRKQRIPLPNRFRPIACASFFAAFFLFLFLLLAMPQKRKDIRYLQNDLSLGYQEFGVTAASTVDLWQAIFGAPEEELEIEDPSSLFDPILTPVTETEETGTSTQEPATTEEPPAPKEPEYNALDIDFESLIASAPNAAIREMHEYFSSVPPTQKNRYTGLFAGKNLIVMCLEGFSDKCVDPATFPMTYKMIHEGFFFRNFYHGLWGGSTATGEYSVLTGNFYGNASCLPNSSKTLQYYALGNLFARAGYESLGYHNNSYTYYSRNLSHPNFGFNFKGIGNGLKLPHSVWPNSDYEMALVSGPEFIRENRDKPFLAYYMTVSGHAAFTWYGNSMSAWHREDIGERPGMSENVKAYIACQYEVELMLRELVRQLEEAGQLENTVFALACDHYPYALTDAELAELYGLPQDGIRKNLDLYRNSFILWCADMDPVVVDTPCSTYDIVPTLANLFGLEYDSRLYTGRDVFGVDDNICIINADGGGGFWNWASTQGVYNNSTGVFTPGPKCRLTEEQIPLYVQQCNQRVAAMRKYAAALLDRDYYRYVFPN